MGIGADFQRNGPRMHNKSWPRAAAPGDENLRRCTINLGDLIYGHRRLFSKERDKVAARSAPVHDEHAPAAYRGKVGPGAAVCDVKHARAAYAPAGLAADLPARPRSRWATSAAPQPRTHPVRVHSLNSWNYSN